MLNAPAVKDGTERERGAMIKLCGLWLGKTKDGKQYLSGGATYSSRFMCFENSFKAKAEDPDYILYVSERQHEKKDEPAKDEPFVPAVDAPAAPVDATAPAPATASGPLREDDIPF